MNEKPWEDVFGNRSPSFADAWYNPSRPAQPTTDKNTPFKTDLHYSDPTAKEERTVFGAARKGLFYNYSDRLYGDKWSEGLRLAKEKAGKDTARYFEIALNHFHDTDDVNLEHVILGCNRATGYSYLVFGYTYSSKPPKTS